MREEWDAIDGKRKNAVPVWGPCGAGEVGGVEVETRKR